MAFPQHGLAAVRWDAPATDRATYEDPSHLPEELGDTPMSAAETAGPTPPHMNIPRDAAVIDISTRASRRQAIRGRGQRMTPTPHHHDSGGAPESGSARELAEHFEVTFNSRHLTLTDRRTAEAYTLTLGIVETMLDGAHAQGIVTGGQRDELHQMIEGMKEAPRLITG